MGEDIFGCVIWCDACLQNIHIDVKIKKKIVSYVMKAIKRIMNIAVYLEKY